MTDDLTNAEAPTRPLTETSPAAARLLPPPRRPQTMTDRFLLQLTEEIVKPLSNSDGNSPCTELVPSYNAILTTARTNHPDDPFLSILSPIAKDSFINAATILALLAQLRIVLESLQSTPST
jgi:hypothetical protein